MDSSLFAKNQCINKPDTEVDHLHLHFHASRCTVDRWLDSSGHRLHSLAKFAWVLTRLETGHLTVITLNPLCCRFRR